MTALEDDRQCELPGEAECEPLFAWEFRVFLTAAAWMLPGCLFGLLGRLGVPEGGAAAWWLIGGGTVGALAGGWLEAESAGAEK